GHLSGDWSTRSESWNRNGGSRSKYTCDRPRLAVPWLRSPARSPRPPPHSCLGNIFSAGGLGGEREKHVVGNKPPRSETEFQEPPNSEPRENPPEASDETRRPRR